MLLFGFYLIKKARIGFDLICLYLFARLEGAVFGFDLYLVICLFIIIIIICLLSVSCVSEGKLNEIADSKLHVVW